MKRWRPFAGSVAQPAGAGPSRRAAAQLGLADVAQILGRGTAGLLREHRPAARHLVEYWQKPEELAHYARATVDILYKFPFSKRDEKGELAGEELEGVAARSDFDLSQHQRFSGKAMTVFDEELKAAWAKLDEAKKTALAERYFESPTQLSCQDERTAGTGRTSRRAQDAAGLANGTYVPHVIEPSAGVDRLALALICNAYCEDEAPDEKGKLEKRVVMRFHPAHRAGQGGGVSAAQEPAGTGRKGAGSSGFASSAHDRILRRCAAPLAGVTGGRMRRARPLA